VFLEISHRVRVVCCDVADEVGVRGDETRPQPPGGLDEPVLIARRERLIDRPGSFTHRGFLPGVVVILFPEELVPFLLRRDSHRARPLRRPPPL